MFLSHTYRYAGITAFAHALGPGHLLVHHRLHSLEQNFDQIDMHT